MGVFTQSSIIIQNIYLTVDPTAYYVAMRDGTFVVERDGTQVVTAAGADAFPTDSDTDVNDWLFSIYRAGGTVSSARQTLVNTLITGLKSDGVWSKLDRLWLLAAENMQSALVDLVGGYLATAVGPPTFTTDRGVAGDGSSSYIDTNYNPATNGVNYTLNAAHLSVWDNTNRTSAATVVAFGSDNSTIFPYVDFGGGGQMVCNINSGGTSAGVNHGTSRGYHLASRSNSTDVAMYYNAIAETPGFVGVFGSVLNFPLFIGGQNHLGALFNPTTDQISAVSAGGNLSATDVTNFYNRLRTYMTACGVP